MRFSRGRRPSFESLIAHLAESILRASWLELVSVAGVPGGQPVVSGGGVVDEELYTSIESHWLGIQSETVKLDILAQAGRQHDGSIEDDESGSAVRGEGVFDASGP